MFCMDGVSEKIFRCLVVLPRMVAITIVVVPVMNGHPWDQASVPTSQVVVRQRDG